MKYLIKRKNTMQNSDLIELPDGSLPLSVEKHFEQRLNVGPFFDYEHWEVTYLEPYIVAIPLYEEKE